MFFGDVSDETFYEIHNRQSFFHILFILVAVIVESNGISIIPIDSGRGYNGPAKIAADVFSHYFRIAEILFGIDIEKRLWQRKGTNLKFPQCGQLYMAPPKEGSPQLIILSIFSISVFLR